jgi:hypothetical protein
MHENHASGRKRLMSNSANTGVAPLRLVHNVGVRVSNLWVDRVKDRVASQ